MIELLVVVTIISVLNQSINEDNNSKQNFEGFLGRVWQRHRF